MDVLAFGETMVELSLDDDVAAVGVAGDTFNTAVYLKRSAPDLDVGYATRLGRDPLSDKIARAMAKEGLDLTHTARGEGLPGLYAISVDDAGERSFHYWRSESVARQMLAPGGVDLPKVRAKAIYVSAITLAILPDADRVCFLEWLEDYDGTVIFDSNYRPRLWSDRKTAQTAIERAWRATDIGLPSLDDEMALFGDADEAAVISRLTQWGVTDGALKRGALGPRPLDGGSAPECPPAPRVVDSTAAGDSFNGGYLAARLTGSGDPLVAGHALASIVVQHRGAILPR